MIEWAGHTFRLIATITTGEWYRSQWEVVAPQVSYAKTLDERLSRDAVDAAYGFLAPLIALDGNAVNREVLAQLQMRFNKNKEPKDYELVFPHLYTRVVQACGWGPHREGIEAFYKTACRSDEFDPTLDDGPCECDECKGLEKFDAGCLFRQAPITEFTRQIAAIDAEMVNEYWDRPFFLFEHARIASTHRALRMASINQQNSRKRKEAEEAAEEKARREEQRQIAWARVKERRGKRGG